MEMEDLKPKEDLLNKYSGKTFAPLQPPMAQNDGTELAEYQALVEGGRAGRNTRFRIIDRKGVSHGCGYAYLIGWIFNPPDVLTLNTTTHTFTFEGRGLEEIERCLMDEKIKELREYNPKTHTLTGEEKTVIQKLEIINRFEPQL
jgi:hypothetical protein